MSSIISGHSHSFDVGVAKTLGINAAIVLNHIIYWLRINCAKDHNVYDGKVWMYESQQDIANYLDYMTLDEVKKAVVKLLDAGVLIKGNYNANPFNKTSWYTTADQNIYRIKKTLTKEPHGSIGNAPGRDVYRQEEHIQEEQQQQTRAASPPAAVFFEQQAKRAAKAKSEKVYHCLIDVDIPDPDKIEITQKYSEDVAKNAVAWATHVDTKINTTFAQAIKWACKNKPQIPVSKEDETKKNREYAIKYDNMKNCRHVITAYSTYVEIVSPGCQSSFTLSYEAKGFIDQFQSQLRKCGFEILQTKSDDIT